MSDPTNPADLPAKTVAQMYRVWSGAFVEGAGEGTNAYAASAAFAVYAIAQMCKIHGEREVSRQLYLWALFANRRADAVEQTVDSEPTQH